MEILKTKIWLSDGSLGYSVVVSSDVKATCYHTDIEFVCVDEQAADNLVSVLDNGVIAAEVI